MLRVQLHASLRSFTQVWFQRFCGAIVIGGLAGPELEWVHVEARLTQQGWRGFSR